MPDLATALQTALNNTKEKQMTYETPVPNDLKNTINSWTQDDPQDEPSTGKQLFQPTNNVTRETFNSVLNNPNQPFRFHLKTLVDRGFSAGSIGTLISQMTKAGMIQKDDAGNFHALQKEYSPIKYKSKPKPKVQAVVSKRGYVKTGMYKKMNDDRGIAALNPQPTAPAPAAFNADELLSTLSFAEVLTLYKKIKTMMGEA